MTTQQIYTPSAKINLLTAGQGPPLLFVHGFPLDHRMWQSQLVQFERTHQVIAPDLPGFGKSTTVDEDTVLTMADYADTLARDAIRDVGVADDDSYTVDRNAKPFSASGGSGARRSGQTSEKRYSNGS